MRAFGTLVALGALVAGCSDAPEVGPDLGPPRYDLLYEGTRRRHY